MATRVLHRAIALQLMVMAVCLTATSTATKASLRFHRRDPGASANNFVNGGIAALRAASSSVSDAVKRAAGVAKAKGDSSYILPPHKLENKCVSMNAAKLPNFHLSEMVIEGSTAQPEELTEQDLTKFVTSYVEELHNTVKDMAAGGAQALAATGVTPSGQTPSTSAQSQHPNVLALQPQSQPTSPNPSLPNNNGASGTGGVLGGLRGLLNKVNFNSKPTGTVSMAELDSSMKEQVQNMVGAPLTQFCEYYKKNEFINKESFVAAKLNQLNIMKYLFRLVTRISVKLVGRITTHVAAAACSFYNSVINKKVCTFGPYRSGHAYLVSKYLKVPCFSGLSPSMCDLEDVYVPLPGKDFVPVDDLYKCTSLSTVLPRCNRNKVVAALSNATEVVQRFLNTLWEYVFGLFTYGATKLIGVHDVLISVLEYMCVMREKPAAADIGKFCRPALAPIFNIGTVARNGARIPFWKVMKNPAVWKRIGQKVAKAAGKLVPIVQWVSVPLDEIGREIRRLACVRAITSAGELTAAGGKVDLTYGETYAVEQYPEAENFIKDAPAQIQRFMEDMVDTASDALVDFLISKAN